MRKRKSKKDDRGPFEVCWKPVLLFRNFQIFIALDISNRLFSPSTWHVKTLPFIEVLLTEETDFYNVGDTHVSSLHSGSIE
jgi:hypothetical protein